MSEIVRRGHLKVIVLKDNKTIDYILPDDAKESAWDLQIKQAYINQRFK